MSFAEIISSLFLVDFFKRVNDKNGTSKIKSLNDFIFLLDVLTAGLCIFQREKEI